MVLLWGGVSGSWSWKGYNYGFVSMVLKRVGIMFTVLNVTFFHGFSCVVTHVCLCICSFVR